MAIGGGTERTTRGGSQVQARVAALALVLVLATSLLPGSGNAPSPGSRVHRSEDRESALVLAAADSAQALMAAEVAHHVYPGATLAAGVGGRILVLRGVGRLEWPASAGPASPDSTMYDLASLSKAVATTTAVLLLAQDGRIRLDDPIRRWLPEFDGRWKDQVTWRHLLTHTSGLPPAGHMRGADPAARLSSLLRTRLEEPPGLAVQYSDLGYVVLWAAAQRAAGEPLPRFLARRVWRPLGMRHTGYLPGLDCTLCAPTLVLNDGRPFRGKPSDPTARKLGGVTGNAGLFSTAADLAHFAAMIANGGELEGIRILRPDLVRELFTQQPHAGRRTLGWDAFCPAEPPQETIACAHPVAFGHYGWTGTSLWVDPVRRLWVVLLANRSYDVLHPRSMEPVREGVFAALARERLGPGLTGEAGPRLAAGPGAATRPAGSGPAAGAPATLAATPSASGARTAAP